MGKRAPANRVDPEDKDEDEDDGLLVLDQAAVAPIRTAGGDSGGQAAGVSQLENLQHLLCGGIVMAYFMGG